MGDIVISLLHYRGLMLNLFYVYLILALLLINYI